MQAEISVLVLPKSSVLSEKKHLKWRRGSIRKCLSKSRLPKHCPPLWMLSAQERCNGVKTTEQQIEQDREDIRNVKHPNRQDASWLWLQLSVTYLATASKKLCQRTGDNQPSDCGGGGGGGTSHCAVPGKFALLWVAASVSGRRASYRRPPGAATADSKVNQTAAAILLKHNASFLHWGSLAVGHCLWLLQFAHFCQWVCQCGSK